MTLKMITDTYIERSLGVINHHHHIALSTRDSVLGFAVSSATPPLWPPFTAAY